MRRGGGRTLAFGQDPVSDYAVVREELMLYNPEYVTRPHILALNKMDLEWAALRTEEIRAGVEALDAEAVGIAPVTVLPVSATEGIGMDALLTELGRLMNDEDRARVEGIQSGRGQAGGGGGGGAGHGGAGDDVKPRSGRKTKETTGEGKNMTIRF